MTEETLGADPVESLGSIVNARESRQFKTLVDKQPGHIMWANDRASFAGCRVITFSDIGADGLTPEDGAALTKQLQEANIEAGAEAIANLYFSHRGNLLVLDMRLATDPSRGTVLTFIITTHLDEEDLEEMQEVQQRVNLEMREWKQRRAERQAADRERQLEYNRLVEVGRNAEQYKWKEKNRELQERIDELSSELNKLKKGAS